MPFTELFTRLIVSSMYSVMISYNNLNHNWCKSHSYSLTYQIYNRYHPRNLCFPRDNRGDRWVEYIYQTKEDNKKQQKEETKTFVNLKWLRLYFLISFSLFISVFNGNLILLLINLFLILQILALLLWKAKIRILWTGLLIWNIISNDSFFGVE